MGVTPWQDIGFMLMTVRMIVIAGDTVNGAVLMFALKKPAVAVVARSFAICIMSMMMVRTALRADSVIPQIIISVVAQGCHRANEAEAFDPQEPRAEGDDQAVAGDL